MRKVLPTVDEMEHFSTQEFCDNIETILDRIVGEDIGIVIDSKDKAYVLCPYSWLVCYEDEQHETTLVYALRYALGRDDESVQDICSTITDSLHSLSAETVAAMCCTLEEHIERNAELPCRESWENLLHLFKEQKDSIGKSNNA